MTGNEYQKAAMRTASGMNYEHHGMLMNGALGLCGESGEVADIVKKATLKGLILKEVFTGLNMKMEVCRNENYQS